MVDFNQIYLNHQLINLFYLKMLSFSLKKVLFQKTSNHVNRICGINFTRRTFSAELKNEQNEDNEPIAKEEAAVVEGNMFSRNPYVRLARLNSQIGTHLLVIPCFWGILLGSPGFVPNLYTMALFSAGALGCRSAGCIINDFADRDIDKHVDRTKARPLTTGELSPK